MPRPIPTTIALLPLVLSAAPALAHPGHLTDLAGHDHWVAGAAIGLAVLAGLWGALKGRGQKAGSEADDEAATDEGDDAPEEQAA